MLEQWGTARVALESKKFCCPNFVVRLKDKVNCTVAIMTVQLSIQLMPVQLSGYI